MDSIFIFLDRIHRIDRIFFTCVEMPTAEGRSIPTILLILSNYFSKIRIHSSSFSIKPTAFQGNGSYEASKFLIRSDWTLAASGDARMKLHEIRCHLHGQTSIVNGHRLPFDLLYGQGGI